METMKKMRDIEIDLDMKIEDVQQAFILIAKYDYQLTKEDLERVENLEAFWIELQNKAMATQLILLEVQEHFQRELIKNLGAFELVSNMSRAVSCNIGLQECNEFVADYNRNGPMQEGLTPRQASDILLMFQVWHWPLSSVSSTKHAYNDSSGLVWSGLVWTGTLTPYPLCRTHSTVCGTSTPPTA